jgi:hypothetical protein
VGVIDGVSGETTREGTAAQPAGATGLTEGLDVFKRVGHSTNGGEAVEVDETNLLGGDTDESIVLTRSVLLLNEHGRSTSRASENSTTTNTALNTGDSSTERKITETHSVTRANIELAATRGHDGVTGGHSLSRDDILKTVIRICDEGNVSRTVGIVFKTLDNSGNIGNGAAEVDKTISRTGTTTTATSSNTTLVVTTTSATLERGKLLNRAVGRVGTKMREYKLRCE